MTLCPCPKPRPALLDKRDSAKDQAALDRIERATCHARSGGRCEVIEACDRYVLACVRPARENHHLIAGIGRRNRGRSILAAHRIDVCAAHHQEITGHVLQPVGEGREDAARVRYERRR